MTYSGHPFFPGSGALEDVGERRGKFYSLNIPLMMGTTDSTFHSLFKPIMTKVVEIFNPTAVVLQCGDSLICFWRSNYLLCCVCTFYSWQPTI